MTDTKVETIKKAADERVTGLRSAVAAGQQRLQELRQARAAIDQEIMKATDILNATGGRLQEAEEMAKIVADAASMQNQDQPTSAASEEESFGAPPPARGVKP